MTSAIELTLAHSPDPDDVFMWWPLTGMVDPRDPARIDSPPELDTGPFRFRSLPADIAVLNRRAIETGDLDITALSMFTYSHVADRYVLTSCGASVGDGYGPKLVLNPAVLPRARSVAGDADGVTKLLREQPNVRIAVPGLKTTAFACLCMLMDWRRPEDWEGRVLERPFDAILNLVSTSSDQADMAGRSIGAGVLIHQAQITYADRSVVEAVDFGRLWRDRTGGPLPLGGNAVRRDLDARYGEGTTAGVVDLLDRSVRYALEHRSRSLEYARRFDPTLSIEQVDRYVRMYVTPHTVDLGEDGVVAVHRLIQESADRGLCPPLDRDREHVLRPGVRRS